MKVLASVEYVRVRRIGAGQGRNSVVFLADDTHIAGRVVVKEIAKSQFPDPSVFFGEAQAMYAAAAASVVPVHWAAETADKICIAMPHYPAGSLADRIRVSPLSVPEAKRICQDICAGARAAHSAGVCHLDIKPTNVFFDASGRALVADFGQSVRLDATGVYSGPMRLYTPYLPPEVITARAVSPGSDVYQIGLTLYRALNGDGHFKQQLAGMGGADLRSAIAAGTFPARTFLPHLPSAVCRVLKRALAANPPDRFQSAAELAEAFAAISAPHAWRVDMSRPPVTRWRLDRPPRASLEVIRKPGSGKSRWNIEVWTIGSKGRRRRRDQDTLWKAERTERQAHIALKRCFRLLP